MVRLATQTMHMHCLTTNKTRPLDLLEIFDSVESSIIVSGHYSVAAHMSEVSNTGGAELMSFELGAELVQRARCQHKTSRIVLWVNDIGISQVERDALKQQYSLPENYAVILRSYQLTNDDISVMYESSVRNKASTTLRTIYKKAPHLFDRVDARNTRLVRCVDNIACTSEKHADQIAYVIDGPNKEPLVVKEGPHPKCNLILATLFHELTKRFTSDIIVTVFNDIYEYRLTLGLHAARTLFDVSTPMMNIFCDGAELSGYRFTP